ncbi:hypothetical protein MLD38_028301 [Melastoma candidum]|uniref:Uncharacterized protein n=1 Tax=Melastoma candidum TaxID=119954 RepID=A0ACB9N0D3_9MYRT|nr:hypothetical protein MLD38_028301 [Melastoma candidum]
MEIDFLGVGRSSGSPGVKEEEEDGTRDSSTPESTRTSEMQWSFADKVSKPSQMLSFQASPEEKAGKTTRNLDPKLLDNSFQNVPAQHYHAVSSFPLPQFQAQPGFNHEMKKFPSRSHLGQPIINAPVIHSRPPVLSSPHFAIGHTPNFPSSHLQMGASVSRDTNAPKSPASPTQLTIFFGGSIYVYDDVPAEKAQAIMSLARSSSSATPSKPVPTTRIQSQNVTLSINPACDGNKSSMLSFSSVRSHQVKTQQVVMTNCPVAVAIPQARKVSLARFLERRKERIIKASPYGFNKGSPEQSGVASDNLNCSAADSTGSIFNSEVNHK